MNTEQAEAPLDGDPSECLYHASLSPRGRDSASPWRILTGLLARHVLGSPRIRAADVERINQVLAPNLQEYTSSTFSHIVARPKSVTRLYIRGQAVAGFVWFSDFTRSHRSPPTLFPGCSLPSACSLLLASWPASPSMLGPMCEEMMFRFRTRRMRSLSSTPSTRRCLQWSLITTP